MSARRDKQKKSKPTAGDRQEVHCATVPEDEQLPGLAPEVVEMIDGLQAERDEANAARMRSLADFKNYQRRSAENEARALEAGKSRVLQALLPVLDQFELALRHDSQQMSVEQLAAGVNMVQHELTKALQSCGLTLINPTPGSEFDPQRHEAITHQPSDEHPPGSVITVFQTGYMLDDFVLRPAKVIIASSDDQIQEKGDG